jgi:hypothetical protein
MLKTWRAEQVLTALGVFLGNVVGIRNFQVHILDRNKLQYTVNKLRRQIEIPADKSLI